MKKDMSYQKVGHPQRRAKESLQRKWISHMSHPGREELGVGGPGETRPT